MREIVIESHCDDQELTVDDGGGGVHDRTGARVGAIRRDPGGEWIEAERHRRGSLAIPTPGLQSKLRTLLTKLKLASS